MERGIECLLFLKNSVALDKASVDLTIERSGRDVLREGYDVDWSVQLEHGASIGLGSLDYKIIML